MASVAEKRGSFRALHASGCFLLPNPFDIGSARYLQHLGFPALATTSAGLAWSLGRSDGALPRAAVLDHLRSMVEATDVPINADFESGYANDPEGVAESVRLCVATGVAGLSIEDWTGDKARPLYDLPEAVERIKSARAAIDAAGGDAILVARSECYFAGHPEPLKEAIRRLEKFAEAGADCLYAPGPRRREDIAAIVKAVAPKPVNVLAGSPIGMTLAELAELGVRRVSVGGALARVAWGAFMRAAAELKEGRFESLGQAIGSAELNGFFAKER
jgi:2-methylisocitrate lyase-like PEP mutase family enzyme